MQRRFFLRSRAFPEGANYRKVAGLTPEARSTRFVQPLAERFNGRCLEAGGTARCCPSVVAVLRNHQTNTTAPPIQRTRTYDRWRPPIAGNAVRRDRSRKRRHLKTRRFGTGLVSVRAGAPAASPRRMCAKSQRGFVVPEPSLWSARSAL